MVIETVFVLVLWNSIGTARGDVYTKVNELSEHATEEACTKAIETYAEKRARDLPPGYTVTPVLSCVKASRLVITGTNKAAESQTWSEWWRSH